MKTPTAIVITGMGVTTPLGNTVPRLWAGLRAGASGIGELSCFDTTGFSIVRGGECELPALPPACPLPAMDRTHQLALGAIGEAVEQADIGPEQREDAGWTIATNFGGMTSGEALLSPDPNREAVTTDALGQFLPATTADIAAATWPLAGPRLTLSLSCASGGAAIAVAADQIRAGRATLMVAVGVDALSRFVWSGLSALRTMTKDEVRPFDARRKGTIFSEGAAALVLETEEAARRRGAPILARYLGGWLNNNAFHMTAPAREGAGSAAVMAAALRDAGLEPDAIDHINAHGTGTKVNDVTETQAIKTVFGGQASQIPLTSIKSMTGHLMGAAGTAEAVASIMSIRDHIIPPTIHFGEPDPECDLDTVTTTARETPVSTVLSNSAGIGGCNAAVIFGEASS